MREAVRYDQDYAEPEAGSGLKAAAAEKGVAGREPPAGPTSGVVKIIHAVGDRPFDDNEPRPGDWHPLAGPAPTD